MSEWGERAVAGPKQRGDGWPLGSGPAGVGRPAGTGDPPGSTPNHGPTPTPGAAA